MYPRTFLHYFSLVGFMPESTELLFRSPYFSVFGSHKDFDDLNAAMLIKSLVHCRKVLILSRVNNESKSVIISCVVFIFTEGTQWQSSLLNSPNFTLLHQGRYQCPLRSLTGKKSLCLGEAPFYQHFPRTFLQKSMSCTCLYSSPIKIYYLRIMPLAHSLHLTLIRALKKTSRTIAFLDPWRTQMLLHTLFVIYAPMLHVQNFLTANGSKESRIS